MVELRSIVYTLEHAAYKRTRALLTIDAFDMVMNAFSNVRLFVLPCSPCEREVYSDLVLKQS